MSQLNRVPFGFLDFVDSKQLGRNPAEYDDRVRLGIALDDYYAANLQVESQQLIQGTSNLDIGTSFTLATVPNDQLWLVENVEARFETAIANTSYQRIDLRYRPNAATGDYSLPQTYSDVTGTFLVGTQFTSICSRKQNWLATPGGVFTCRVGLSSTVSAGTLRAIIHYRPLSV